MGSQEPLSVLTGLLACRLSRGLQPCVCYMKEERQCGGGAGGC